MTETPNSSLLSGYEYDSQTWILTLHFKAGKSYEYLDFSPENFDEFVAAKSLGGFYNSSIKGHHESREVTSFDQFAGERLSSEESQRINSLPVKEQMQAAVEADDALITDEDIRRAHPDYQPKAEAPAPEILSPEQALAVMAPKNPKVDELTRRAHALAGKVLTVTNAATQADMESHLVQLATVRKALFEIIDPYREIAYRAYEQVQILNKGRLDPIDSAVTSGKAILKGYLQAEQAKAAAEQRRLDAEARAKADEDQRKRTEQMRIEAAEQKQAEGDTAGAEQTLFDQTIQAPPVYTPPVRVEQPTSSLGKKGGVRENWKGEVVNLEEAILDVAEGIKASRESGGLRGHLPTTLITINPTIVKQLANTNKAMASFPGLRFWDDGVIAVRTAKE